MNQSTQPFIPADVLSSGQVPSSALFKIALLLVTGVSVHFSLTPPHTAAPKTIIGKNSIFERAILWVTFCTKMMVWLLTLSDMTATYLAAFHPESSFSCPHSPSSSAHTFSQPAALNLLPNTLLTPSPLFVSGALACLFGSLLRQWCFYKLGHLFTFEMTIHPQHNLITTGPYRLVRHPSYTGVYFTLLGSTVVGLARGSWLREYWFRSGCADEGSAAWAVFTSQGTMSTWADLAGSSMPTIGQAIVYFLVAFWLVKVWYALQNTNKRTIIEDQELRKLFGEPWDVYAQQVRWRLCPGVF